MSQKTTARPIVRKVLLVLALLLLGFLLFQFVSTESSTVAAVREHPLPTVPLVPVIAVEAVPDYQVEETFLGRVEAARSSRLGFELAGTLESVAVKEGEAVEPGELLARLDDARLQARHDELRAATQEAAATLTLAEASHARTRQLVQDNVATQAELDAAIKERDAARATLQRVEAQWESVRVDLRKMALPAPFAGIVARRYLDEGAVVAPGEAVLELVETGTLELRVGLTPAAADSLVKDQSLTVRHESGREIAARVSRKLPVRNGQTRTVDVLFTTTEPALLEGDLIKLTVPRMLEARGFWLPLSALTEGRRGLWACFVLVGDTEPILERRQLEVLHVTADTAFVRGALRDGEQVVTDGIHKLTPGLAVKAAPRAAPSI